MTLLARLAGRSVKSLTQLACVLALIGLAFMVYSIVSPRALPVIFAMSVGHAIGGAGFACYLLAVLIDVARGTPSATSEAAPAPESGTSNPDTPEQRG
jgi:hypothetical protein